jgi:hypothetical protein
MRALTCILLAYAASFVAAVPQASVDDGCASLVTGDSYFVSASRIAVDTLSEIPAVAAQNPTISNTKPLCRVVGQIPYGENNTLNFEVWLPESESYNERYLSVGMCCGFVSGFLCG